TQRRGIPINSTRRTDRWSATTKGAQAVSMIYSCRSRMFRRLRELKSFNLFLDFICERRRAGAVYDSVVECDRERDDFGALVFVFVGNEFPVRGPNEQRTDRWGHNNRRAGFHFKRAETRYHDRRVHRVNATASCRGDCLVVGTDELRPALLICICDDG